MAFVMDFRRFFISDDNLHPSREFLFIFCVAFNIFVDSSE
jgi:hypothetical protein